MDPSPLLKLLSDGTGWGVAGIFMVLFLGSVKLYLKQSDRFIEILRENIDTQNRQVAMNNKLLRLLGVNGTDEG